MAKTLLVKHHILEKPYEESIIEDLKENLKMNHTERYETMIRLNEFVPDALRSRGIHPFEEDGKYVRKIQIIKKT